MEEEKKVKNVRDLNIALWSLITLAFLGLLWKGFLTDIGVAIIMFVYYIGLVTCLVKK